MSLPSLALLRATGVPVTVCARPWAQDLLAGIAAPAGLACPELEFLPMRGAFSADRKTVRAHVRGAGAGLRALTLPDSLSSAAVFRLAGLPTAGYRDDGRSFLLRWPITKPPAPVHAVESWYFLTRAALSAWSLCAGPAQPGPELGLRPTASQQQDADAVVADAGLAERPFVLIAPTATGLHRGRVKVWPGFAELSRRLQARGIAVAMCPPPAELDQARQNAPDAQVLAPLGLGAFAALTTRAALVVANDSGVSHVAAAVGARQITLFGVTQRERTGPWSPRALSLGEDGHWPAVETVLDLTSNLLQQTGTDLRGRTGAGRTGPDSAAPPDAPTPR